MNHEAELSMRVLVRDRALELRGAYEAARNGSPRWKELEGKYQQYAIALARAVSSEEAEAIFAKARADIEAFAAADRAAREAEHARHRHMVDQARLDAHRRQHRQAWREQVNRATTTAIDCLVARLREESSALTGRVESEPDIRAGLTNIADALTAMSATVALETRASITRENDAAKAAAA